jgi:hypothetical protein
MPKGFPMTRSFLLASLAGGLLALAACARTPIVSYNMAIPPPSPHEIRESIGGRDVPVAVIGSPFPTITSRQLAAIIVSEMPSLYAARYYPVDALTSTGIVWYFGVGITATLPVAIVPRDIRVDLQLVQPGNRPISEVQGHVSDVHGPTDPAFASFVHQMTLGLLMPSPETYDEWWHPPMFPF